MFIEKVHPHKADYYGDVRTLITGLSFQCPDNWETTLNSLDEESDLTLRKEPDNPHDKYAIAAYLGDRRIGYVSKDDNCSVYMFIGEEPVDCKVIDKYKASFKVSFEHPKKIYDQFTPEQIFQLQPDCDYKGYDNQLTSYEIPVLDIDNDHYDWYEDTILMPNMEKWIVDFNRKFVSNKIELVCRQTSDGKFYYYLPYLNWDIAEVRSQEICDELERLGIGIGLVDVATLTYQDTIVADIKVALRKDYSGLSAMSYFRMKRENKDFNFVYELPKKNKILSISEEVFANFINENIGCDVLNSPDSSWKYDTTDFLGNGTEVYETYIFKKRILGNPKCNEIVANVVRGKSVNFSIDIKMNKKEIFDFVYRYKKQFFPDYTLAKCKKEYGKEEFSIYTEGISPSLDIRFPFMGDPCSMIFYTSFCNKTYIDNKKVQKKVLTIEK